MLNDDPIKLQLFEEEFDTLVTSQTTNITRILSQTRTNLVRGLNSFALRSDGANTILQSHIPSLHKELKTNMTELISSALQSKDIRHYLSIKELSVGNALAGSGYADNVSIYIILTLSTELRLLLGALLNQEFSSHSAD
jgi:hypothetical protein